MKDGREMGTHLEKVNVWAEYHNASVSWAVKWASYVCRESTGSYDRPGHWPKMLAVRCCHNAPAYKTYKRLQPTLTDQSETKF